MLFKTAFFVSCILCIFMDTAVGGAEQQACEKADGAIWQNDECVCSDKTKDWVASSGRCEVNDTKKQTKICESGGGKFESRICKCQKENTKWKNNACVKTEPANDTITVTGIIKDSETGETVPYVNVVALDSDETNIIKNGSIVGTASDINGRFTFKDIPSGSKIKISCVGYETQIISVGQNLDIKLVMSHEELDDIIIVENQFHDGDSCEIEGEYIKSGHRKKIDGKWLCVPKECVNKNYEIKETENKTWACVLKQCPSDDYELKEGECVKKVCQKIELDALHALEGEVSQGKCVPTKCIKDYNLAGSECVQRPVGPEEKNCLDQGGTWNEEAKKCTCGDKATWKGNKCICNNEIEDWDMATKTCKVNDKKEQEKACKDVGKDNAKWDGAKCICVNEIEDWKYDSETGTGKCEVNEEKKNKQNCEKLGTDVAKWENNECVCIDEIKTYDPKTQKCEIDKEKEKAKRLADKQKAYDEAKAKEQSTANKMLGGLTTAATGLGAMELMQGLSEQKADDEAAEDMAAYLATFRCTYAGGKSVKGGAEPIELPGGNDKKLMELRNEYVQLAASLKERKESLGMKPGIESEEILDKAEMGLYDDENVGITKSVYASLYRAQTGSAEDQAKIDAEKSKSEKRVKGGAIAAGIGVVGGIVGDSLINGKLGDKIKEAKADKQAKKKESDALDILKKCLKDGGATNTDNLKFNKFTPSVLDINKIDCKGDTWKKKVKDKDATKLFEDSEDADKITKKISESFGDEIGGKLLESFLE